VRKADNLPPSCANVKNSGGLNLLEPCGPVQACNGTALKLIKLYNVGSNGRLIFDLRALALQAAFCEGLVYMKKSVCVLT
jgi:hypothetical protein